MKNGFSVPAFSLVGLLLSGAALQAHNSRPDGAGAAGGRGGQSQQAQRAQQTQSTQQGQAAQQVQQGQQGQQGQTQRTLERAQAVAPATRGFSIVLVLGDLKGAGDVASGVPESARKALADMKDFLPYKSYQLLDVGWLLGSGGGRTRLKGLKDDTYDLGLTANRQVGALRVAIKVLGDVESPQDREMLRRFEELKRHGLVSPEAFPPSSKRDPSNPTAFIDANFTMSVGETVVVGTSRVDGDKALILLLTAVPEK